MESEPHSFIARNGRERTWNAAGVTEQPRDFDPALALDGGIDGLDAYRVIAGEAKRFLADGGMVAVEIGYDQRQSVTGLFLDRGFRLIEARKDLAGHDRALMFGSS